MAETYPISDYVLSRPARRCFAPLQKSPIFFLSIVIIINYIYYHLYFFRITECSDNSSSRISNPKKWSLVEILAVSVLTGSVAKTSDKLRSGGGGGGYSQRFIRGSSAPMSNPLPFYKPFLTEKDTPFLYLLLTNGTSFTYLVQNFASPLTSVNAVSKIWMSHKTRLFSRLFHILFQEFR